MPNYLYSVILITAGITERGRIFMDIWELLIKNQNKQYYTVQNLPFTYTIKGNEMFISRKDKSITYSTVKIFYERVMEKQRSGEVLTGPKKIGTFGASYLYPIFLELGIIQLKRD